MNVKYHRQLIFNYLKESAYVIQCSSIYVNMYSMLYILKKPFFVNYMYVSFVQLLYIALNKDNKKDYVV